MPCVRKSNFAQNHLSILLAYTSLAQFPPWYAHSVQKAMELLNVQIQSLTHAAHDNWSLQGSLKNNKKVSCQ